MSPDPPPWFPVIFPVVVPKQHRFGHFLKKFPHSFLFLVSSLSQAENPNSLDGARTERRNEKEDDDGDGSRSEATVLDQGNLTVEHTLRGHENPVSFLSRVLTIP